MARLQIARQKVRGFPYEPAAQALAWELVSKFLTGMEGTDFLNFIFSLIGVVKKATTAYKLLIGHFSTCL